jgi:hypothetical protein
MPEHDPELDDEPEPESEKPIPREFHSEYEERPFQNCSRCGELLSIFDNYQINKAYRNGECVFEYCFCSPCRDSLLEEFSEESKINMLRHQEENLREVHGTGECAFCGKSKVETPMKDYIITALCRETSLIDSLMICEGCQLGMHELLSEKTRDVRRRFFEELPGVPPDWEVWTPEESEATKAAAVSKSGGKPVMPSPVMKGESGADSLGKPATGLPTAKGVRHRADDGCLELLWPAKRLAKRKPPGV